MSWFVNWLNMLETETTVRSRGTIILFKLCGYSSAIEKVNDANLKSENADAEEGKQDAVDNDASQNFNKAGRRRINRSNKSIKLASIIAGKIFIFAERFHYRFMLQQNLLKARSLDIVMGSGSGIGNGSLRCSMECVA
jgi:hypothetical protein